MDLYHVVLFCLIAVIGFVQTAKLSQSRNWSPGKTRFFFVVDALFALMVTAVVVTINFN